MRAAQAGLDKLDVVRLWSVDGEPVQRLRNAVARGGHNALLLQLGGCKRVGPALGLRRLSSGTVSHCLCRSHLCPASEAVKSSMISIALWVWRMAAASMIQEGEFYPLCVNVH